MSEEAFDFDGDGFEESVTSDLDGDGAADMVVSDTDGDGEADLMVADLDFDGYADTIVTTEPAADGAAEEPATDVGYDPETNTETHADGTQVLNGEGGDALYALPDGSISFSGTTPGGDSISFSS